MTLPSGVPAHLVPGQFILPISRRGRERRARTVSNLARRTNGVLEAVATAAGPVTIEFDRTLTSEGALRELLDNMSVDVRAPPAEAVPRQGRMDEERRHEHGGILGENTELIFAIMSGARLASGFLLSFIPAVPARA